MRVSSTLEDLKKTYGDDVRIVFKNFVVHPDRATDAHLAGCAANNQGKFWEFEKKIWTEGWSNGVNIDKTHLDTFATEVGLNMDQFHADMASDKCKQKLSNDMRTMSAVGVNGTPAFYINGRPLSGAQPEDAFKAVIDQEMKKAAQVQEQQHIAPEDYYGKVVVQGGKKSL